MMENYLSNFVGADPMRNALSKMIRSNDVKPMTDRRDGRVYHNCRLGPTTGTPTAVCLLSDLAVLCADHVRLFQRLRKYTARGITVMNAPPDMLSAGFPKALLQLSRG